MKKVLLFILLIASSYLKSQTEVEKLLFDKINQYRLEKHLNVLTWDSSLYKMATHHSTYLAKLNSTLGNLCLLSHGEERDVENFDEIGFSERVEKFLNKNSFCHENCAILISKKQAEKDAETLFNMWKNSPKHNKNMLEKTLKKMAVSVEYYSSYSNITNKKTGYVLNVKIPGAVATLDLDR